MYSYSPLHPRARLIEPELTNCARTLALPNINLTSANPPRLRVVLALHEFTREAAHDRLVLLIPVVAAAAASFGSRDDGRAPPVLGGGDTGG